MNKCGTCKYFKGPDEDGEYECNKKSKLRWVDDFLNEGAYLMVTEDFGCVLWEAKDV